MNVFLLDSDPTAAAQCLVDRHDAAAIRQMACRVGVNSKRSSMKLTVNRQALLDELRLICPSIARHEITPICLCVRITTNESIATGEIKLVLDSVSNDRQFTAVIDADVNPVNADAGIPSSLVF